MNKRILSLSAVAAMAVVMSACAHDASVGEEVSETPTVYYAMTDIFQPEFQGVADTAFYAYNDDGDLDGSLLTEEQWASMTASAKVLKETALQFTEEANIRVALPGEELFNEGQGFIAVEDVQALIDENPDGFKAMMAYLAQEADGALTALEARDAAALSESSDKLYAACKSCHTVFWYPGRR